MGAVPVPSMAWAVGAQSAEVLLKSYVLSTTVKNFQLNFIHVHVYGYMYAWVLDVVPYGGVYLFTVSYSYLYSMDTAGRSTVQV